MTERELESRVDEAIRRVMVDIAFGKAAFSESSTLFVRAALAVIAAHQQARVAALMPRITDAISHVERYAVDAASWEFRFNKPFLGEDAARTELLNLIRELASIAGVGTGGEGGE